ncbi:transmembrane protein 117-like isoform X2 [Oratosquilla oratoria]|uniref:transmembrane protein 117-like isoform X2 n=1 Tax=Oratosquilla oratoria TaxID=337810 RepID=UPI003F7743B4
MPRITKLTRTPDEESEGGEGGGGGGGAAASPDGGSEPQGKTSCGMDDPGTPSQQLQQLEQLITCMEAAAALNSGINKGKKEEGGGGEEEEEKEKEKGGGGGGGGNVEEEYSRAPNRRAASCDLVDAPDTPTPITPRALTPGSVSSITTPTPRAINSSSGGNFWRDVSPQLSYIDGSIGSSLSTRWPSGGTSANAPYGRSISWNLGDSIDHDQPPSPMRHLTLEGGDLPKRASSHEGASGTASPTLPSLQPITRFASDSLCSPSALPTKNSVVQVEKGDIKTKIQKRLSFGDTLGLHTNIYTPAEECVGLGACREDGKEPPSGVGSGVAPGGGCVGAPDGSFTSLEKRWEEDCVPPLVRRKSMDTQSQYSYYMDKDLRYYFQHPWLRLIVAYLVIFCNFLLFAEDPVSHSHAESNIPVVGNVFSFVATKYPEEWYWRMIKVVMWLIAILCGMLVGKVLIHGLIFKRVLRLKMFREEQGSWMTMFMTVIVSLFMFSHVYNLILLGRSDYREWQINSAMGVTNENMMKAAATCTWLGDLITALMVTDMMLQDNLYPHWAAGFRRLWRLSNVPRILIFWIGSIIVTGIVIFLIVSNYISWDELNKGFVETTELSRAFLASFILFMDLLIVMQDWDFPHFTSTIDVNLPGFSTHTLHWKYLKISMTGKWFNYGIIFLVLMLDLNMWKNQIFYRPEDYGQYIDPVSKKVYTVESWEVVNSHNASLWTWEARIVVDPATGDSYLSQDMFMFSRYMGYSMWVKCTAFIPSILGFVMLFTLISLYGRFPPNQKKKRVLVSSTAPASLFTFCFVTPRIKRETTSFSMSCSMT